MKKLIISIVAGAISGAAIGVVKDSLTGEEKIGKSIFVFGIMGALIGTNVSVYNSVNTFKMDVNETLKNEVSKEIKDKIDFKSIKEVSEQSVNKEVDNIIKSISEKAERKIDKTIKAINQQNIFTIEKDTNDRLNKIEETVRNLKPSVIFANREIDKNDLIREAIASGKYDAYDLRRLIDAINESK